MLQGVDVSKWQGKIDWSKMAAKAPDFVIIRAGSADANGPYTDYQFENNVNGASLAGIPWAFYWFLRPNLDVKAQADYFVDLAYGNYSYPPNVDLWCDIEVAGDAAKVLEFCQYCGRGSDTGIYTNPNTIKYLLTGNKTPLAQFPLWLADWSPPYPAPAPWTSWLVLQYAVKQDGQDYGCESKGLDHNQALDSFLSVVPPPPSDLEARVKALEESDQAQTNSIARTITRLTMIENRLTALEARPPATISAPFKMASRTPARCITRYNDAGKPIFEIYPRDSSAPSERIFLDGTVQVFPYAMVGDGARKAFPVYKSAPQQLYVFVEDGRL
jgi:hypothetical protein